MTSGDEHPAATNRQGDLEVDPDPIRLVTQGERDRALPGWFAEWAKTRTRVARRRTWIALGGKAEDFDREHPTDD